MGDTTDEIIRLNVQGQLFETFLSTLTKHPETLLSQAFLGEMPFPVNASGEHCIDRNPRIFSLILEFYRAGKVGALATICNLQKNTDFYKDVIAELEFFKIPESLLWPSTMDLFHDMASSRLLGFIENITLLMSIHTTWLIPEYTLRFSEVHALQLSTARQTREAAIDSILERLELSYYEIVSDSDLFSTAQSIVKTRNKWYMRVEIKRLPSSLDISVRGYLDISKVKERLEQKTYAISH